MNEQTADKGTAGMAIVLWAIVVVGLLYGIVNTAGNVVDLFTG
jgi:hypothetical protein